MAPAAPRFATSRPAGASASGGHGASGTHDTSDASRPMLPFTGVAAWQLAVVLTLAFLALVGGTAARVWARISTS